MGESPGDYGVEGFTLSNGIAFQCYCPEGNYSNSELYEKQRDKITKDLGKLKTYKKEIAARIGGLKIQEWHFVTPVISKNDLHVHVRNKEVEVRGWGLDILSPDFSVQIRDGDFYHVEINQVRMVDGEAICFESDLAELPMEIGPSEEYETNLQRKSEARITNVPNRETRVASLYYATLQTYLQYNTLLKQIESTSPTVFFKLAAIINEYEITVEEQKLTWVGTPQELVDEVREKLSSKISNQLSPHITVTQADKIARHVVARWLAVCQLDFE